MNSLVNTISAWDRELFLILNGTHNDFWDFVMWWASDKFIWIPVYALLLYILWRRYKGRSWILVLFVAFLVFLSDQVSVHLFKDVFQRLRPCHDPALAGMVHIVKGKCGGQYGFYSSHASNIFAISVFFLYLVKAKTWKLILPLLLWAGLIAYSRVYLGVHYPGDIVAGAVAGSLLGWLVGRSCLLVLGNTGLISSKS